MIRAISEMLRFISTTLLFTFAFLFAVIIFVIMGIFWIIEFLYKDLRDYLDKKLRGKKKDCP